MVFAHSLCAQIFCPSYKGGGGHAAILHTILCYFYYPGDSKGVGHGPMQFLHHSERGTQHSIGGHIADKSVAWAVVLLFSVNRGK